MVGVVVQMATREYLCVVPALIDSNNTMLEARPHPSYQWASGFARNARLAQPSEWARGLVRIRYSACSHQPSSFVPSPTLLAFILGRMHTNAILSVAVRRTAMGAVEPALGQLIGCYHTILGQTPTRLGPGTDKGRE